MHRLNRATRLHLSVATEAGCSGMLRGRRRSATSDGPTTTMPVSLGEILLVGRRNSGVGPVPGRGRAHYWPRRPRPHAPAAPRCRRTPLRFALRARASLAKKRPPPWFGPARRLPFAAFREKAPGLPRFPENRRAAPTHRKGKPGCFASRSPALRDPLVTTLAARSGMPTGTVCEAVSAAALLY